MKRFAWRRRIDVLCGWLNVGLAAVAITLSVIVAIRLTARAAILLDDAQQQITAHGDYAVLTGTMN
ncbi:MAG: hypothetical protein KGJ66_11045 [Alphaproteobacteria bacterium]|nr:hypothetical protein [Alphaproteobacteria bacterium]